MRRALFLLLAAGLALTAAGCGRPEPVTAGGKPVEYWVQALRDPAAAMRKKAAQKLGNVGLADPAAVPALVGALEDREAVVRAEAVLALLRIGPSAKDALPGLDALRQDRDARVRTYAAQALEKIRGGK